jgi:hypothetical protein
MPLGPSCKGLAKRRALMHLRVELPFCPAMSNFYDDDPLFAACTRNRNREVADVGGRPRARHARAAAHHSIAGEPRVMRAMK